MRANALAEALKDFGPAFSRRPAPDPGKATVPAPAPHETAAPVPTPPSISEDDRIEAAKQALRETLVREHEETLAAERERHRAEIETLRHDQMKEIGAVVVARLDTLDARAAGLTEEIAARILGTALSDDLKRRAIEALARTISKALADNTALRIEATGPGHLHEPLALALGPYAERMDFTERDTIDLTVSIDETLYETRLGDWASALAELFS